MDDRSKTFEGKVLQENPEVRQMVTESEAFQSWKQGLPSTVVDDVTYFVRGGDMLQDEDQIVFAFAHRSGLLTDELIEEAARDLYDDPDEDSGWEITSVE
jgi:hypothetical protein